MTRNVPSLWAPPTRATITGLILAGGQSKRMGGRDKGLQIFRGQTPLIAQVMTRLGPQVESLLISANRNLQDYAAYGWPVLADSTAGFHGPLSGMLAGLQHCHTPWLAVVPCDAPWLPTDLVARLSQALQDRGPSGAVVQRFRRNAQESRQYIEPVFCLLHRVLAADLAAYLANGGRRAETWLRSHVRPVLFEQTTDDSAFVNINTLDELQYPDFALTRPSEY